MAPLAKKKPKERLLKVIILGDGSVGKTSLVDKFFGKRVDKNYLPTLGANVQKKVYNTADTTLTISLWDVGGQRSFNMLQPSFFQGAGAAFLVFDATRVDTLEAIKGHWIPTLRKYIDHRIPVFIVQNKIDAEIDEDTHAQIVNDLEQAPFPVCRTSAVTGENIPEVFELLFLNYLEGLAGSKKSPALATAFLDKIGKTKQALSEQLGVKPPVVPVRKRPPATARQVQASTSSTGTSSTSSSPAPSQATTSRYKVPAFSSKPTKGASGTKTAKGARGEKSPGRASIASQIEIVAQQDVVSRRVGFSRLVTQLMKTLRKNISALKNVPIDQLVDTIDNLVHYARDVENKINEQLLDVKEA